QSGADRAHGDGFHDGLWQAGSARARRAESREGALSRFEAQPSLHRKVLQRVRRTRTGREKQSPAQEENHRWPAARTLLSRVDRLSTPLRHRNDAPRRHGHRGGGAGVIKKVTSHLSQNEALLFERGYRGKKAYQLPGLDVPAVDAAEALGAENVRKEIPGFPEVSEVETIRHFTRLSTWNYAIDYGMYPLGSCTMKYNPRINELVARTEGLAAAHPYQPAP